MGYKKAYMYAEKLKKKILLKLKKHGKNAKDLIDTIEFILGRTLMIKNKADKFSNSLKI